MSNPLNFNFLLQLIDLNLYHIIFELSHSTSTGMDQNFMQFPVFLEKVQITSCVLTKSLLFVTAIFLVFIFLFPSELVIYYCPTY